MVAVSLKPARAHHLDTKKRLTVNAIFTFLVGRGVKRVGRMVQGRLGWVSGATLSQAR